MMFFKKIRDCIHKWLLEVSPAFIEWIGSTSSVIVHTILFVLNFVLYFFGVSFSTILLILTTAVSIEAIYLAIFMQMSICNQSKKLNNHLEQKTKPIDKD